MKKILFSAFFFSFVAVLNAQKREWTLQECIEHALENNISIKQSELEVELAEVERRDAIGNFLPSINASASNAWNTGLTQNVTTGILQTQTTRNFSAGVTAGLTLFDGLRNFRQLQRAKMSQLASQYSLEQMQNDVALFVANSYLQVLFSKENLKIIEAQHRVTLEQLERSQELVDAGSLPSGDLLEIRATAANEEQRIIVAQNDIRVALIALAQILLIKDYENFDIVERDYEILGGDILNMPINAIIEQAKEERPEVRVAEESLEIAEMDVDIARGAYLPSLGAFFNYNTRESGAGRIVAAGLDPDEPYRQIGFVEATEQIVVAPNMTTEIGNPLPFFEQLQLNDGITYGVQLSIPILNGMSVRNAVKRNQVNAMRAEYQLEQTRLDLEANVYQAYVDAQGALKAYEAALLAQEAQELAYEYAMERFNVGLTNAFDFTQATFNLGNARSELARAKYDYIFKVKVLELYFGVPITELKY